MQRSCASFLNSKCRFASANAAFKRFDERIGGVTPEGALASSDAELGADGFSRQKASYVRGIAELILSGEFDPKDLTGDFEAVKQRLLGIRGIGPWTASCYLLFVCGDRDTWPTGDPSAVCLHRQQSASRRCPEFDRRRSHRPRVGAVEINCRQDAVA